MTKDPRVGTPESVEGSGGPSPHPEPPEQPEPQLDGDTPVAPEESTEEVDVAALSQRAAKADEYLDLAQRTRAEFENYRRRAVKEAATAQDRGAARLALELLPAIDNLDRALAHAAIGQGENGDASLVDGIKHVQSDVLAALKRAGIEPFFPEGEPFDPTLHEAVAQRPFEGAEPGTVIEVYQRGYRQGESVLRPARVVVAG
jgi:molecular chaperone GrpE